MAHSIEEPQYEVVADLNGAEIRLYAPTIQAVTTLPGSGSTGKGFKRLADFIFGGNQEGMSIAMTAPVQETLYVDSPEMAFTMPSQYAMEDLPEPNSNAIKLVEVPERYMAVVSFSGWATPGKINSQTRKLMEALTFHGVEVSGTPALNQYNPPWTPPFLRRNEIAVEVPAPAAALVVSEEAHAL